MNIHLEVYVFFMIIKKFKFTLMIIKKNLSIFFIIWMINLQQ